MAEAAEITLHPGELKTPRPRRRWRRIAVGAFVALLLVAGIGFSQRHRYADNLADLSRSLIGDENTARLEGWYFALQDRVDRTKYSVFGGETNPFAGDGAFVPLLPANASRAEADQLGEWDADLALRYAKLLATPPRPAPFQPPQTQQVRTNPLEGEGAWTTVNLPRTSPGNLLMAKTFFRPDPTRPYATVAVLVLDKRRIRLHITGGTEDPGGDRGVKGPGIIPESVRPNLLVAWNGGFQGPHGGYGMVADGKTYRPLRNGLASVAIMADGSIRIGEWGRDMSMSEDVIAVRQNAVLLVDNCQVSKRTKEGNDTWGYVEVNSAEFITWRSAIGITQHGDLLVAAGNSLSAATLAQAMWAAGACYAMQLDINSPYVLTSLYFPQENGSMKPVKLMDSMSDNPNRFFSAQKRDFMYVTLDETNYVP